MAAYPRPHPEPQTRADAARLHHERPELNDLFALLTLHLVRAAMESA